MSTGLQERSPDGRSIRVLILEDDANDVAFILRRMRRDGLEFEHRVTADETEFRAALYEGWPDVVISDFCVPEFDGSAGLLVAREIAPSIPFIFVSGTIGEERAIEALKNGASDYVFKENLRRLVPAIRAALQKYEIVRERDLAEYRLRKSESRLQDIVNTSADWIWECDREHRFTFSSASVVNILGYAGHEMINQPMLAHVAAEDRNRLKAAFVELGVAREGTVCVTIRWVHRSGKARWLERKMVALRGTDGDLRGFRGTDRNVTERFVQDRALRFLSGTNAAIVRARGRRQLLREACRLAVDVGGYQMATVYVCSPEPNGDPVICRAVSSKQSEAKRPDREPMSGPGPVGRAMSKAEPVMVRDLSDPTIHIPGRESLLAMGLRSCVALPLVMDGTSIGVVLLHAEEADQYGETELGLLRQIAANITFSLQYLHGKESVEYLAYFDTLTTLANRSLYIQRMNAAVRAADCEDDHFVVLVFDITGLSTVNDGLGHHAGDLLLQLIAERLKNTFRNSNCLCHLGGGRYAVFAAWSGDDASGAAALREQIGCLFEEPYLVLDQELRVSVKAGFAQFPEDGTDAEALLHSAETALDHAKQDGEKYLRHHPGMNAAASEQLNLANCLRKTVAEEGLALHYQPKLSVLDGRLRGFEALLRWPDSDVPPNVFVAMLETSGLIDEVGRWVVARALAESHPWNDAHSSEDVRIAVNVSTLQLRREAFADEILEILAAVDGGASRLEVEVTESMLMQNPVQAGEMLGRLRAAGVKIAIDDFGTGHSSLQVLSRLPVDVLKIDRSFVRDLETNHRHRVVVQTTISLAKSLELTTVAEGVETEEQVKILRDLGCDVMQGYLIRRPAGAAEITAWLDSVYLQRSPSLKAV